VKRGHCTTPRGIRLGYLSTVEVSKYTRTISRKFKLEKLLYRHARIQILQLKTRRLTMRESTIKAFVDYNLIKFCNNIIIVHRIGTFGGKEGL